MDVWDINFPSLFFFFFLLVWRSYYSSLILDRYFLLGIEFYIVNMKNFFELSFVVIWFFFCLEDFGIYYVSLFPYFLAQKDDPVSSYTLPQLWNQPFLQWVLVPISGEWFWEAKKWVPIVEGMVLLLGLSCKWTKQGNILTYMHKGMCKFISISIILFSHNYSNFCIICLAIWKTISLSNTFNSKSTP